MDSVAEIPMDHEGLVDYNEEEFQFEPGEWDNRHGRARSCGFASQIK